MAEVEIGKFADFAEGDYRVVDVDGLEIGVFRIVSEGSGTMDCSVTS